MKKELYLGVKKKDRHTYDNWNKYLESTKDRTNYSIRRMDLLVISISGGGLYIVFETIRVFKTENMLINNILLLKLAGISLLSAIVVNFVSQITGYHCNNYEEKYVQLVLEEIQNKNIDKCLMDNYDRKSELFKRATKILNIVCISFMLLGLLFLVVFNFSLF